MSKVTWGISKLIAYSPVIISDLTAQPYYRWLER